MSDPKMQQQQKTSFQRFFAKYSPAEGGNLLLSAVAEQITFWSANIFHVGGELKTGK